MSCHYHGVWVAIKLIKGGRLFQFGCSRCGEQGEWIEDAGAALSASIAHREGHEERDALQRAFMETFYGVSMHF